LLCRYPLTMFFQSIDASPNRPPPSNRTAGIPRQGQQFHPSMQDSRMPSRRASFEDRPSNRKHRSLSLNLPQSDARSIDALELSPHRFHSPRQQGSAAGSVASAPTVKHHPRELRDPGSTSARSLPKINQHRDESPPSTRKSQLEDMRRHSKAARKLIIGTKKMTMKNCKPLQ
jgi:hypothetical protein